MSDLRDRLHHLDALEVPDVMQKARRLGPKPPIDTGPRPVRRIAIAGFALLIGAASVLYVTRTFDRGEAPIPVVQSPTPEWSARCAWTSTNLALPKNDVPGRHAARLVAGTSMSDLWVMASNNAFIDQYLLHFDGQRWREITLPKDLPLFSSGDMVAAAPNDLWLLAPDGVARFDGEAWSRTEFSGLQGLDAGDLELNDLEVVAADDAWVTGNVYDARSAKPDPLILHWDGRAWSRSFERSGSDVARIVGVSAWGPDDVWAAGVSQGKHRVPVALHWDGTAWTSRPVLKPKSRAASLDIFGLEATGPDEALMTVRNGVVSWKEGAWSDSGFDAASDIDVPVDLGRGTTGVWAKVWNTAVARWDGQDWQLRPLKAIYAYGMVVIDDAAVFVGGGQNVHIIDC